MKCAQRFAATLILAGGALLSACKSEPRAVYAPDAPKPLGPYSQAEISGNFVFGAEIGIDPKQDRIVATTAEGQTAQAMQNVFAVLRAAGSGPGKLVKVTLYFKDLDDFDKVNAVYARMLGNNRPARAVIQVDRLPLNALIEIEYMAQR